MPRIAALVVAALLIVAAPASAQEKVCRGQDAPKPPPTEAEKAQANLEHYAEQRAEFGFRHDLPYVQELIRRGVWEYDVGYIPVTPRENVYLKLRDELEIGTKGDRYLRRHRDVVGGISVEDNWPREPYLLVRFKKDVAKHLRALKRVARYPNNLRATASRFSERDLQRVANQVWRDAKKLRADGFILTGTGIGSNRAHVDVITQRKDAADYFNKRYGPAVKVEVGATEEFAFQCAPSGIYEIAPDGMSLIVHWESGGSGKFERFELAEFADHIEVGVVERVSNGPNTADLRYEQGPMALSAPLGDRAVISARRGTRMLQSGPSPGEPPCPVAAAEPTRLERAIRQRQQSGLPADPAYVQQRLDSRSYYTRAEQRWLQEVEALGDEDRVDAYLRKHGADYSGSTVVATFPAKPFVVYRFARNTAVHEAAIKRRSRYPDRIRTETVTFTGADIERLEETIRNDATAGAGFLDGYGDAGFLFEGANFDDATATILVRVRTPRTDAAAYLTARYGPLVRAEVTGDRFECRDTQF